MASRRIKVAGTCPVCGKRAERRIVVYAPTSFDWRADRVALDGAEDAAKLAGVFHAACDPAVIERQRRRDLWQRQDALQPLIDQANDKAIAATRELDDDEGRYWSRFKVDLIRARETGTL